MSRLSDSPATVEEYIALRSAAGLTGYSVEAATIGLGATMHGAWLRTETGRLIGMGRLIGDGGCFAQVTDIAVHPEFQRQGLGRAIMTELMGWAEVNLPKGCFISLIADPGAEKLYQSFGFDFRMGMGLRIG